MAPILVIPSCTERPDQWDGGDSVIWDGLARMWPELASQELRSAGLIDPDDMDAAVADCRYIVQAGTPAWNRPANRVIWRSAIRHQKRIVFLGIGMGVWYRDWWWHGSDDFMELRDSGLIDRIVCRDKLAYYWICHRAGFDSEKITVLPCPGFFAGPPIQHPATRKRRVIVSVPDLERTSRSTPATWFQFWDRMRWLVANLEAEGAAVRLLYQRIPRPGYIDEVERIFDGRRVSHFASGDEFYSWIGAHDCYIGVRNHGALPCAGMGRPALLLGVDERQYIADEIPYISRIDISHLPMEPTRALDWWRALNPRGVGQSLIDYRRGSEARWREILEPLNERVGA